MRPRDRTKPWGVLKTGASAGPFEYVRSFPSSDLAPFVEHYWTVRWDLRGAPPHIAETLPHPSVHLVIERGHPEIPRIITGRFTRELKGRGRVFGIKFRPAAFQPFLGTDVAILTKSGWRLRRLYGAEGDAYRRQILAEPEEPACVRIAEAFLRARLPELDPDTTRVRDMVERMATDRTLLRVEQVASVLGVDARSLQRLFRKYVGLSPKWVLQRYRLQEAAELLAQGPRDLAKLALELGYFDQAHFSRDFRRFVGRSPGSYARASDTAAIKG
jgi:AraC-like DNA-binding protein